MKEKIIKKYKEKIIEFIDKIIKTSQEDLDKVD